MADTYKPGELFVYVNGDRWELGMVKALNNTGDGYFCWYSRGDTAANTPTRCMYKLANAGFTHIEQMLDDDESDWCPFGMSGFARCEADKVLKTENARLREENKRLRAMVVSYYTEQLLHSDDVLGEIMAEKKLQELGAEVR